MRTDTPMLTPSEVVFLSWATRDPAASASTLGRTLSTPRDALRWSIAAALLAHEGAGVVTLEEGEETYAAVLTRRTLRVVPTPHAARAHTAWPSTSLEGRLVLSEARALSEVLIDWMARESEDPVERAIEQGMVMLTVADRRDLSGAVPQDVRRALAEQSAVVEAMLTECERSRPLLLPAIEDELSAAVKRLTHRASGNEPARAPNDPWLDETLADQERFGTGNSAVGVAKRQVKHARAMQQNVRVTTALLTCSLLVPMLISSETGTTARPAALSTALIVSLVVFSAAIPIRGIADWDAKLPPWMRTLGSMPSNDASKPPLARARLWRAIILVSLITTGATAVRVFLAQPPLPKDPSLPAPPPGMDREIFGGLIFWGAIALLLIMRVVLKRLKRRAAVAIDAAVMQSPAAMAPLARPVPRAAVEASSAALPTPKIATTPASLENHRSSPLRTEIFNNRTVPTPPPESEAAARIQLARATAIRQHFRLGITLVVVVTCAVGVLANLPSIPFALLITGLITVGLIQPRMEKLYAARQRVPAPNGATGVVDVNVALHIKARLIRPILLPLVHGFWLIRFAIQLTALSESKIVPSLGVLIHAGAVALLGYLIWFAAVRRRIERDLAMRAPQQLLQLRVFGSSNLETFLEMTREWSAIGARLRLEGPGTSGQTIGDVLNVITGRVHESIIDDDTELRAALDEVSLAPDRQLRFPVNSMQCNNHTWQAAVDAYLDRADAVVMDLAGLTAANRGVAYELSRIMARMELRRVLLLINSTTDHAVLQDIIDESWHAMPFDSPNRAIADPTLRILDLGPPEERQPTESLADWQRRRQERVEAPRLLALLHDMSMPSRTPPETTLRDDRIVHWSQFAPPPVRALRSVALGIMVLWLWWLQPGGAPT